MASFELLLEQISCDRLFNLASAEFVLGDLEWNIGNNESDDNLDTNNHMFHEDSKHNNVCTVPKVRVPAFKILHKDRLLV